MARALDRLIYRLPYYCDVIIIPNYLSRLQVAGIPDGHQFNLEHLVPSGANVHPYTMTIYYFIQMIALMP